MIEKPAKLCNKTCKRPFIETCEGCDDITINEDILKILPSNSDGYSYNNAVAEKLTSWHMKEIENARKDKEYDDSSLYLRYLPTLLKAVDILLIDKDYDGHGYEIICHERDEVRKIIEKYKSSILAKLSKEQNHE